MSKLFKVCKFSGGVVFEDNPCVVGYEVAKIERDRTPQIAITIDQNTCVESPLCQEYATESDRIGICPWVTCLISGSLRWLHEMELEDVDEDID